MNRPDPDWYAADLKGEPLRVNMFTTELAARIRAEAEAVRQAGSKTPVVRRYLYFGAVAGCLAAILLMAIQQDRLALPGLAVGDSAVELDGRLSSSDGGQDAVTGSATVPAEADGGAAAEGTADGRADTGKPGEDIEPAKTIDSSEPVKVIDSDAPIDGRETIDPDNIAPADNRIRYSAGHEIPALVVREPTGEEWQMLIDVSYPRERTEYRGEESYGALRRLIFSSKMTAVGEELYGEVAVYEFELKAAGWQRSARWGYTPSDNLKGVESGVITASAGFGPEDKSIDLLAGFVLDLKIVRMSVTDERGEVYEARMFPETDGVRSWFVSTPEQPRGRYLVQGFDEKGNVLYETTSGWHSMKYRQPEDRVDEGSKS
jgi:hypothetical protein